MKLPSKTIVLAGTSVALTENCESIVPGLSVCGDVLIAGSQASTAMSAGLI